MMLCVVHIHTDGTTVLPAAGNGIEAQLYTAALGCRVHCKGQTHFVTRNE
jgi:hypothetical protein